MQLVPRKNESIESLLARHNSAMKKVPRCLGWGKPPEASDIAKDTGNDDDGNGTIEPAAQDRL